MGSLSSKAFSNCHVLSAHSSITSLLLPLLLSTFYYVFVKIDSNRLSPSLHPSLYASMAKCIHGNSDYRTTGAGARRRSVRSSVREGGGSDFSERRCAQMLQVKRATFKEAFGLQRRQLGQTT